jgi:hypothetical protein
MILDYPLYKIDLLCVNESNAQAKMSISGLLFLNAQIRKEYDRTMRVQVMKYQHESKKKAAGGLQDASSQEPSTPDEVQPWPEEARPKVEMPV